MTLDIAHKTRDNTQHITDSKKQADNSSMYIIRIYEIFDEFTTKVNESGDVVLNMDLDFHSRSQRKPW